MAWAHAFANALVVRPRRSDMELSATPSMQATESCPGYWPPCTKRDQWPSCDCGRQTPINITLGAEIPRSCGPPAFEKGAVGRFIGLPSERCNLTADRDFPR